MAISTTAKLPGKGEPVWPIAQLYPDQGEWNESEYLALETNHLVEFTDGFVEFLTMPNMPHQLIVHYLFRLLDAFVLQRKLGRVFMAPTRVRIRPNKIREPDVFFIAAANVGRMDEYCCNAADLVIEVVSGDADDRKRDLHTKREDYAEARITEYWIVDPRDRRITVLKLEGDRYVEHGVAGQEGTTARSALLEGFEVPAENVWAAARTNP